MRQETSDIILALHRSIGEDPPWIGFLRALGQAAGGAMAHLILHDDTGLRTVFGTGALPIEEAALERMRFLRPYSGDDIPAPHPFRALRMRVEGGGEAFVTVARQGADFSASHSVLLGHLAPHMAQAIRQFWNAHRARLHAAGMGDLAQRAGLAWVMLGAQGAVIAAHSAPASAVQGGRLRLPPLAQKRVMAALETGGIAAATLPEAQALLVPYLADGARGMLYFLAPRRPAPDHTQALVDLFQLTKAEARFAARLAAGDGIEQAGAALNLSAQTARFYSKQLYAKLATKGQADLIRRMENSVYRLL